MEREDGAASLIQASSSTATGFADERFNVGVGVPLHLRLPAALRCVSFRGVAVCCSVLQCVAVCCSVLQGF